MAKATCEQYKQSIRKVRQKGMTDVRKNKKGKSEDDVKMVEKMVLIRNNYLFLYLIINSHKRFVTYTLLTH